ncbi:MAG TPA: formyltransferase family protein [Gaiellaceae bacterium]|jgi:methionyl-tRNA formyltransferase
MGRRVAIISNVLPVVGPLVGLLRELEHEPVAWLIGRRPAGDERPLPPWGEITDKNAPQGVNILFARGKEDVAPLFRGLDLDVTLCWGFNWKLPQDALDVPRLGSVNNHPALLPRHRGPYPLAWAFREGDPVFGSTWHRMDAEFDTGPILAQSSVPIEDTDTWIEDFGPRVLQNTFSMVPQVFKRLEAGDPGDPQTDEGASWAGPFEEDYAAVDWSQSARDIHNQVRAWRHMFGSAKVEGPIAELDGERLKILRTSLTDPGGDARRVECGDGSIWITESEPAA